MVSHRKQHDGIFGSPSEPIFNIHPSAMSADLLVEWLQVLACENNKHVKQASHKSGHFLTRVTVEFVFQAATKLDLPVSAKYLAVELIEKFMLAHVQDLYNHARGLKKSNRRKEWKTILDRVRNQLALRVLSCCQIASKLTSHYKVISPETVRKVLSDLNHNYSRDSVLQSEIRVLKTVKYQVMLTSPLLFIETLLEIVGYNDRSTSVKTLHGTCIKLLDLIYLRSVQVYDCLHHVATGRLPTSTKDKMKIASIKKDYMLQGVAVIAASSYIVDQTHTDKVVDSLSQITRIPSDDILDFATIIVQQVIDGSSHQ